MKQYALVAALLALTLAACNKKEEQVASEPMDIEPVASAPADSVASAPADFPASSDMPASNDSLASDAPASE